MKWRDWWTREHSMVGVVRRSYAARGMWCHGTRTVVDGRLWNPGCDLPLLSEHAAEGGRITPTRTNSSAPDGSPVQPQ